MRHITRRYNSATGIELLPYVKQYSNGVLLNPITVSNPYLSGPSLRKLKRGHIGEDGRPIKGKYGNRYGSKISLS